MTDKDFLQSLQIALTAAEKACGKESAAYLMTEIMYTQVRLELLSRAQERDKSIEERAYKKYEPIKDDFMVELSRNALNNDIRNAYINGATEQHQIDIDKACNLMLLNGCFSYLKEGSQTEEDIEILFRKAME